MATRRGSTTTAVPPSAEGRDATAPGNQTAEAELRELNATLEKRVVERTLELEQAKAELERRLGELDSSREAQVATEARYRAYVDNAPDGIFVIDAEGRYVDVNMAACEMTGYSREELLGMSVTDLAADSFPGDSPSLVNLVQTGSISIEPVLRHKDGSLIYTTLDGARLSDDRFIGFCKDNTRRHEAEDERRVLLEQLRHKQKLESLGLLAEGIAHDFNNRLVGILGTAELMLDDLPVDSSSYKMAKRISEVARQIRDLSLQMLVYSGKGLVAMAPHGLASLINGALPLLEKSLPKKVQLRVSIEPGSPTVVCDAPQLRQVITNLVTNAAEAIGRDVGTITLTAGILECDAEYLAGNLAGEPLAPGRYPYIEVTDTGCGMDAETIARMCDPFFSTKLDGRGLGLSVVQGIVRGHRGAIRARSWPGEGSSVTILLTQTAEIDAPTAPAPIPESSAWLGSGTVLLVDDEEIVRDVGRQMLERLGFDVLVASDGMEALSLFESYRSKIRCIILDLSMPRMDGEETLAELRRFESHPPVLISTGFHTELLEGGLAERGVAGVLQKPFDKSTLATKLRDVIDPVT